MYEFPYGAGQQLNLNWIINEIITLHKQLDPDYELPNFDNAFPYMNLNQLNLDWILRELKAIKDLAPTEDAQLLKMVANALLSASYDSTKTYDINDIVYNENENRLYKCITAITTPEAWNDAKWQEIKIAPELSNVYDTLTGIDYSNAQVITAAGTDLNDYTNGGIWFFLTASAPLNKPANSGNFGFLVVIKSSTTQRICQFWVYSSSTSAAIWFRANSSSPVAWSSWLKIASDVDLETIANTISNLSTSDIANLSSITGETTTAALNLLFNNLNQINFANATVISTENEDLNNYTDGGIWFFPTASAPLNKPANSGNFGFLVVIKSSTTQRICQFWVYSSSTSAAIWFRANSSSPVAWSSWLKITTDADLATITTAKQIPIQIPTADNLPSGITAVGAILCYQAGNVVTVHVSITRDTSITLGYYATITDGFPIPAFLPTVGSSSIPFGDIPSAEANPTGRELNCTINAQGQLRVNRGETNGEYRGSFMYITNDFSKL